MRALGSLALSAAVLLAACVESDGVDLDPADLVEIDDVFLGDFKSEDSTYSVRRSLPKTYHVIQRGNLGRGKEVAFTVRLMTLTTTGGSPGEELYLVVAQYVGTAENRVWYELLYVDRNKGSIARGEFSIPQNDRAVLDALAREGLAVEFKSLSTTIRRAAGGKVSSSDLKRLPWDVVKLGSFTPVERVGKRPAAPSASEIGPVDGPAAAAKDGSPFSDAEILAIVNEKIREATERSGVDGALKNRAELELDRERANAMRAWFLPDLESKGPARVPPGFAVLRSLALEARVVDRSGLEVTLASFVARFLERARADRSSASAGKADWLAERSDKYQEFYFRYRISLSEYRDTYAAFGKTISDLQFATKASMLELEIEMLAAAAIRDRRELDRFKASLPRYVFSVMDAIFTIGRDAPSALRNPVDLKTNLPKNEARVAAESKRALALEELVRGEFPGLAEQTYEALRATPQVQPQEVAKRYLLGELERLQTEH